MKISSFKRFVKEKVFNSKAPKVWDVAQDYELRCAIEYMNTPGFKKVHHEYSLNSDKVSNGYYDDFMTNEFFQGDKSNWDNFIDHITGKSCLDVGPCIASPFRRLDVAKKLYAIEPLFDSIDKWQKKNLKYSIFENMKVYGQQAEVLIPELVNSIDGAIFCRNMLDHTPDWPFVMANISKYAKPGCNLLLWTDLNHGEAGDDGHFDICHSVTNFRNLVDALGFNIINENCDKERDSLNWGCLAVKK